MERVKEQTLQAAREEVLRQREAMDKEREEERGELESLRSRTNALIQRRGEVKKELKKEREMVEREWRRRMEVLEEQKKDLSEEVTRLKERLRGEERERDLKHVEEQKEGEKQMADRRSRSGAKEVGDVCSPHLYSSRVCSDVSKTPPSLSLPRRTDVEVFPLWSRSRRRDS